MTLIEMMELVNACTYKPGWKIRLVINEPRPYIQISTVTLCSIDLKPMAWKSAKTFVSNHMCKQEVVAAVYNAIERAELHECREFFRYRGASIFNPHLCPDALANLARKKESFNLRKNAMDTQ